MEYIQPNAGSGATTAAQTSLAMPADPSHQLRIVNSVELHLRSKAFDAIRSITRVYGAELSSGAIALHPVIQPPPARTRKLQTEAAAKHQFISFKNPAGKTRILNLGKAGRNLELFRGYTPFYDPGSKQVVQMSSQEVTPPFVYRLLPTGEIVVTEDDPEEEGVNRITTHAFDLVGLEDSALELLGITDKSKRRHFPPMKDNRRWPASLRARIAAIYKRLAQEHDDLTLEELTEAGTLLHFAPFETADDYLSLGKPIALSMARALEVMRSYHLLPGSPPPVHYTRVIRLD